MNIIAWLKSLRKPKFKLGDKKVICGNEYVCVQAKEHIKKHALVIMDKYGRVENVKCTYNGSNDYGEACGDIPKDNCGFMMRDNLKEIVDKRYTEAVERMKESFCAGLSMEISTDDEIKKPPSGKDG